LLKNLHAQLDDTTRLCRQWDWEYRLTPLASLLVCIQIEGLIVMATRPRALSEVRSTTLFRRCAGPCLLFIFILALPLGSQAQLTILTTDPYARLIFEPVPLPLADDSDTGDNPGVQLLQEDNPEATRIDVVRSMREREAAIEQVLEQEGIFSPFLREQYQSLALQQQRLGQHEEAVASLETAMHIARVNEGLFAGSLIGDLELIIDNLEASGNHEREAEYRSYLFLVQQSTYSQGDPRLIAASQAWAGWNLRKFQQDISANPHFFQLGDGKRPEEFVAWRDDRATEVRFIPRRDLDIRYVQRREVFLDPFTGIADGAGAVQDNTRFSYSADMIMDYRLRQARDTWARLLGSHADILDADTEESIRIQIIDADHSYRRQIDQLLSLGNRRSATLRTANSRRDVPVIGRGYLEGVNSLQRIVDKRRASEVPDPVALARSLIRIGDLHMGFDLLPQALQSYNEAWQVLQIAGLGEDRIAGVMNPQPLIRAPEFVSHYYSRSQFGIGPEDPIDYRGYIDVRLHISRKGDGKKIAITQASKGTPQRVRNKLLDHLRTQKFRPLLANGKPVDANNIDVRFFYHY
jgi:hypothetical protein